MHVDWALLVKYFQERCSEEELIRINQWKSSNPEHQRFFEEMNEVWQKTGELHSEYFVNKETGWKKLSDKLSLETVSSSGKKLRTSNLLRWAAVFVILVSLTFMGRNLFTKTQNKSSLLSIKTGSEKRNIVMSDSSQVTLNKHSRIEYPRNFDATSRTVYLKGTAFFSVTHHPERPFVVTMPGCVVKVVGTSFYLNSDSISHNVTLIVTSGKVRFFSVSKKDSYVEVIKDEKAVYEADKGTIVKENRYAQNEIVWKTGNFMFEEETLQHVCRILSSYYLENVIIADSSLLEYRITASFQDQGLTKILEAIEATLDIKATKKGRNIVLSLKK
jgi:transmembrane sensor